MKKCPFCAEEIQDEAIKCKHCCELLSTELSSKEEIPKSSNVMDGVGLGVGMIYLDLNIKCGRSKNNFIKRKQYFCNFNGYREISNDEFSVILSLGDFKEFRDTEKSGILRWVDSNYSFVFNTRKIHKGWESNVFSLSLGDRLLGAFLFDWFSRDYERPGAELAVTVFIRNDAKKSTSGKSAFKSMMFYEKYFKDIAASDLFEIFRGQNINLFEKYNLLDFTTEEGKKVLDYLSAEYNLEAFDFKEYEDNKKTTKEEYKTKNQKLTPKLTNVFNFTIEFDEVMGNYILNYEDAETVSYHYTKSSDGRFMIIYDEINYDKYGEMVLSNLFLIKNNKIMVYRIPIKPIYDLYLNNNGEVFVLLKGKDKPRVGIININGEIFEKARDSNNCYFGLEEIEGYLRVHLDSSDKLTKYLNNGCEEWCDSFNEIAREKYNIRI